MTYTPAEIAAARASLVQTQHECGYHIDLRWTDEDVAAHLDKWKPMQAMIRKAGLAAARMIDAEVFRRLDGTP